MEKKSLTISIYTENTPGILNRITTILLKRHINIESLNVSRSEIENVHRFTIVVFVTVDTARKMLGQIEKQVEVIKAYYHTDEEIIFHQTALYKLDSELLFEKREIQNIFKEHRVNILVVNRDFFVVEKTGRLKETQELYEALKPYGILQFVRSGRVAVSKETMNISQMLRKLK